MLLTFDDFTDTNRQIRVILIDFHIIYRFRSASLFTAEVVSELATLAIEYFRNYLNFEICSMCVSSEITLKTAKILVRRRSLSLCEQMNFSGLWVWNLVCFIGLLVICWKKCYIINKNFKMLLFPQHPEVSLPTITWFNYPIKKLIRLTWRRE